MIYSGILGTSYSQFGNFILGDYTQAIQDITDNTDFINPVTVLTYHGEEWIANLLANPEDYKLYIGWGIGTGDISKEDDELFEEDTSITRNLARIDTKEYWPTAEDVPETAGMTVDYIAVATLTAVDDISISEAGLFDAEEGGNLLMHSTFDDIPLLGQTELKAGDQVVFTFALNPS